MKVLSLDEIEGALCFLNKNGPAASVDLLSLLHTARLYHEQLKKIDNLIKIVESKPYGTFNFNQGTGKYTTYWDREALDLILRDMIKECES